MIRRIEKLEARLVSVQRPCEPPSEEDVRWSDALHRLLERLEPEQRSLVLEDIEGCSERRKGANLGKLTSTVLFYVEQHLKAGTPLELPGSVASVYLQDPDVQPDHECADCGYDLPFQWPHPRAEPPRAAKVYFEFCPLCGGKVGYYAFYSKHGYFKTDRPDPGAPPPSDAGVHRNEA
jgi:hypothetical protein